MLLCPWELASGAQPPEPNRAGLPQESRTRALLQQLPGGLQLLSHHPEQPIPVPTMHVGMAGARWSLSCGLQASLDFPDQHRLGTGRTQHPGRIERGPCKGFALRPHLRRSTPEPVRERRPSRHSAQQRNSPSKGLGGCEHAQGQTMVLPVTRDEPQGSTVAAVALPLPRSRPTAASLSLSIPVPCPYWGLSPGAPHWAAAQALVFFIPRRGLLDRSPRLLSSFYQAIRF